MTVENCLQLFCRSSETRVILSPSQISYENTHSMFHTLRCGHERNPYILIYLRGTNTFVSNLLKPWKGINLKFNGLSFNYLPDTIICWLDLHIFIVCSLSKPVIDCLLFPPARYATWKNSRPV